MDGMIHSELGQNSAELICLCDMAQSGRSNLVAAGGFMRGDSTTSLNVGAVAQNVHSLIVRKGNL
jgi:hypothetical protein